ncbi:excise [Mycobacterium phage FirstPlacePfu]|uniref:Excise n=1 Tax=Mycobacterium phage FirstPlacePfu TaxID=2572533 RepID=A0A4D6T6M8_9CAUD|nr:excisionase and transcriptional regulator [Mycobacterium phage FirstPlacePfu]QCG77696.1 excise [Mycobacterium phage FirstPlacePfu]
MVRHMSTTTTRAGAATEIVASEACRILNVDRSTLLRWVAAEKVTPTRKLPGSTGAFLFDRDAIEELAAARKTARESRKASA